MASWTAPPSSCAALPTSPSVVFPLTTWTIPPWLEPRPRASPGAPVGVSLGVQVGVGGRCHDLPVEAGLDRGAHRNAVVVTDQGGVDRKGAGCLDHFVPGNPVAGWRRKGQRALALADAREQLPLPSEASIPGVQGELEGHGAHGHGKLNFENFYAAQVIWDETMAWIR